MNNIKVIFVNWTKPYFFKEDAQGYNKLKLVDLSNETYEIVDYELLIQETAVRRAKRHIGPTKLYTDNVGYEFYKKNNMIDLWDEIDVDTLESFNKEYSEVNPGRFWTTGKSIVMGKEPIPYLFIDLDFIVRSKLPSWITNYDLVHTQWEVQRGEFFVFEEQIREIGGIEDFNQNMMVPNTSFVFMNNEELRNDYLKKHLDIITRRYDYVPEWLWLIADQGILGYSARKLKSKVESIENRIYMSYAEVDSASEGAPGRALFWVKDPNRIDHLENLDYEHVWFSKYDLKMYPEIREKKMQELKAEIEWLKNTPNIL
jgi:hypothetical protein